MMKARHGPKTCTIRSRWTCGVPTFDLDEHYLECIAAFQAYGWRRMIFANRYDIYYTPRLSPGTPRKGNQMPTRKWGMGDRLADTNFGHRDSPLRCVRRSLKPSSVLDRCCRRRDLRSLRHPVKLSSLPRHLGTPV